jgi:enoyl-CoA hydratase/carnithine racemase
MKMGELVRFEVDAEFGIANVMLARPEKLNALNADMIAEFIADLDEAERDPRVRIVPVTGEGGVFRAGQDTGIIQAPGSSSARAADRVEAPRQGSPIATRLMRFGKPAVAAMRGTALGAGLDIALACDFRIADESCRMGDWHVLRGIVPGAGLFFLPRLVGTTRALDMLAFGTIVQGEGAVRIGLVHCCVSDGTAREEGRALADRLSRGPRVTLGQIERLMWRTADMGFEEAMETIAYARAVAAPAAEGREAMAGYREKREPDWRAAARAQPLAAA